MSSIQSLSLENAAMMKKIDALTEMVKNLSVAPLPKSKAKSKSSASASASSASAEDGKEEDDSSVKSKRSIGAGTQAWIDISGKITPLVQKVKAALTEEAKSQNKEMPKFGPIHLKAAGYLKSDLKNEDGSFKEPSYDQVHAAVLFLMANPDHKSANADAKSKKEASGAPSPSAPSAAPSVAPEQKEKAKPGRKPDPLVAARKAKEAEEKAAKASAKEQKKPQTASNAAAAPASAWAAPSAEAEEEEAEVEEIEIDGEELYFDPASGKVYERNDGALGDEIGTYDGITLNRTA
jgi:hypothetical protein